MHHRIILLFRFDEFVCAAFRSYLPSMQKSFFRNFVALIFAAVILYRERPKVTFTPKSKRHLFWRAFFGTVGVLCNFYAVDHLVLADASMLNKMSPFFAVIFAIFLLKEKPNHFQTLSIITAFIGVLFIVKPTGNMNSFLLSSGLWAVLAQVLLIHTSALFGTTGRCWAIYRVLLLGILLRGAVALPDLRFPPYDLGAAGHTSFCRSFCRRRPVHYHCRLLLRTRKGNFRFRLFPDSLLSASGLHRIRTDS